MSARSALLKINFVIDSLEDAVKESPDWHNKNNLINALDILKTHRMQYYAVAVNWMDVCMNIKDDEVDK